MSCQKLQQPDHTTPTKEDASEKCTKENQLETCPVCDTAIAEDADDIAGEDAVYWGDLYDMATQKVRRYE